MIGIDETLDSVGPINAMLDFLQRIKYKYHLDILCGEMLLRYLIVAHHCTAMDLVDIENLKKDNR